MSFIEKKARETKLALVSPEEQLILYTKTFRCPKCYLVPSFTLNLDLDDILTVEIVCPCGTKELEINDFLNIYSKDFRGNLQCISCKEFATKNPSVFKYCLKCKEFYCGECQYDHMVKEEHSFINFKDVGTICNEHKIYYQSFCKICKKNICKDCYQTHGGHKIVNYNTLYISDLEMEDFNKNYGKVQLIVLFKDTEIKETIHSLLKDVDELNKNYITELFDANKQKNTYILEFFKILLNLYNNTAHKTYELIMNIRNNVSYNISEFEIDPNAKIDDNTLLNKFYLYSKNHCIAKKPPQFREKIEKIDIKRKVLQKEAYEVYCHEIMENIDSFTEIVNNEYIRLNDGIDIQIQSPFKYKNYIYFGEYQVGDDLIPHGRGVQLYNNGDKYYGNFKKGKKDGVGVFFFKNGTKYLGEWKKNKMEGYGIYYFSTGAKYEGYFKANQRNGPGILTTKDGTIYKSIWKNGIISDYGKIFYSDGRKYEGYIHKFSKEKKGSLKNSNGDLFEGDFIDDSMNFGKLSIHNGDNYIGYFKENKFSGYGKYIYKNLGEVYEGQFNNGKKQGIGKYFYRNGDIYEGYWFDDMRNGYGFIKFYNGDWYQGMFVKDLRHGIGIYFEQKGYEYYLGEWADDNKEGVATIYNQNWYYQGSVKDGIKVGYATFIYEDTIYTGGFKDNMCDGYGTLISAGKNQIFMTKFIKGRMKSEIDQEKKINEFEIINK